MLNGVGLVKRREKGASKVKGIRGFLLVDCGENI